MKTIRQKTISMILAVAFTAANLGGGGAANASSTDPMISDAVLEAVETGFFQGNQGKVDQWRVGYQGEVLTDESNPNRFKELNGVVHGVKFNLEGIENTSFIKAAKIIYHAVEKEPTTNHVYKTDIYPMTTEWPGGLLPWEKPNLSDYSDYPNPDTSALDSDEVNSVAVDNIVSFEYNVTQNLKESISAGKTVTAFAMVNRRENDFGSASWEEKNCFNGSDPNTKFQLDITYMSEAEISDSIVDITANQVRDYLSYLLPDSAYFDITDTTLSAQMDQAISNAGAVDIATLEIAVNLAVAAAQVTTAPANGQSNVSLNTKQITFFASKTGENKRPVTTGSFTLKDSGNQVVSTSFSDGVITIAGDLQPSTIYTLSWVGVPDIQDGFFTFTTSDGLAGQDPVQEELLISTKHAGFFYAASGKTWQFRIGVDGRSTTDSKEFNGVAHGAYFDVSGVTNPAFIKKAAVTYRAVEKAPTANYVYKTDFYPMTTDWPSFDVPPEGNVFAWKNSSSTYSDYPNPLVNSIASANANSKGKDQTVTFEYDITQHIKTGLLGGESEMAYAVVNRREGNFGADAWDETNCFDGGNTNTNFQLNITYMSEAEILASIPNITTSQVRPYIEYLYPDSAYFDITDHALIEQLNTEIIAAHAENKTAFIAAVKRAVTKVQVETDPTNGQDEVTLSLNRITFLASKTGINKQPVQSGTFTLKDSAGNVSGITVTNGNINISETLQPETTYILSWTGVSDIQDGSISFMMTGVYVKLTVLPTQTALGIGETSSFSAIGEFTSGTVHTLQPKNVVVTVADPNVLGYHDGTFTANMRGVTDVTFLFKNEIGLTVSKTISYAVYHKNTFFENTELHGNTQTLTTEYGADFVKGNVTSETVSSIKIGSQTYLIPAGSVQFQIDAYAGTFHIDGVEVSSALEEDFTSITLQCTGEAIFSDLLIANIHGTVCYADFVTVRNANEVNGEYTYYDSDDDVEVGTTYRWMYSSSESGSYSVIPGETGKTLSNASAYAGNYIKFEVTPKNSYDSGVPVVSAPLYLAANPSKGSTGGGGGSGKSSVPIGYQSVQTDLSPDVPSDTNFKDVPQSHWAYAAIAELQAKGILSGDGDGYYNPDNTVTRAEFVCALVKALNLSTGQYMGNFNDVTTDDWYAPYLAAGVQKGMVSGYETGAFGPNDFITREQVAVIVAKAFNLSAEASTEFADNDEISSWAVSSVNALAGKIVKGKENNRFAPKENATRAEMASILVRVLSVGQ